MPLVRVEVRNEYGLGMPELYTETDREDPKAVLDGVAVAGLVGILRQLGDLAEFAAEVFHGLQEQVLITSSRSHKLVERVHNIEAALPPLEKAILAQRSHLHFAYTAGSHWHTRIRTEQNHFIYGDLPRCIMDSYEDCRDPPRLHKLDKFDIGGPGACFRRYSDPTYFKRTSVGPYEPHLQSVPREKKARRNKKKRSSFRYRDATHGPPVIMPAGITDFGSSNFEEKTSPVSQDVSTFHVPQKPEIEPEVERLTSFDSRNGSGYIECIFRPSYSTQSEDNIKEPSSDSNPQYNSHLDSDENIQSSYSAENSGSKSKSNSPYITWDEKLEIIDSTSQPNDTTEIACETEKIDTEEKEDMNLTIVDQTDFDFHGQQPESTRVNVGGQHDEIESETDYYMDALNTIESESETDPDCHTKRELIKSNNVNKNDLDDSSASFEFRVPEPKRAELATSPPVAEISELSPISLNTPEEVERHVPNKCIPAEPILITLESPEPFQSTSVGQSQSQSQTTATNPVMFWTNGGLLGLEPSKPPDFGLPTTVVEETKTENTINENTGVNVTPGVAESAPKDDHDPITSSRIFEFSNRLLVNGFRKQISLVGNEKLASSVKTEIPEKMSIQNGFKTVTGIPFREQFGNIIKNENNKPLISPSSPPLEHMKISFQPIDGFETNKLKLTFPDENSNMFPSFQLVPECSISLHESGSDSDDDDDDTFCRSSPYASDDLNSNQSESNSENWDSTRIKDHELDDAFGIISSAESVSSSIVNGIKFQQNGVLFDIPKFDPVNDIADPTPPPPPLPPVEWRGVKPPPHHHVTNEKEDDLSEALTFALNLTPQQPKQAPRKQEHVEKDDRTLDHKQPDWQNLHVHNASNRAINGKMEDEKEDFLQQIRTKSLNLRRTSTPLATTTPVGTTSVKVTAILEKASAIRQAVGSDDGEDDTWSDT